MNNQPLGINISYFETTSEKHIYISIVSKVLALYQLTKMCNVVIISLHFRFEACWPAMARDAHGAVFIYNPDVTNHDKELENW